MTRLALVLLITAVSSTAGAQEKPSISVPEIAACVQAHSCRNMTPARVNWYDQINIPVVEFSEGDQTFALRAGPNGLSIWVSAKGGNRPSKMFSVGDDGRVLSGDLAGGPDFMTQPRMSAEEREKALEARKALSTVRGTGEEFRSFWQEEADRALAAIRWRLVK